MSRALESLEGLSVGDAFGERFFCAPDVAAGMIARRAVPAGVWRWTDDTAMASSVVEELDAHGGVDRDALARRFAARYAADPARGYGGGAHGLLRDLAAGGSWQELAPALFDGGSYGNGAAMRVAPLGAYFADDMELTAHHAAWSADPTHAHHEGRAGAIAIAVAAAFAWQSRGEPWSAGEFFEAVRRRLPASEVAEGVEVAARMGSASVEQAARRLGNGARVSAQDTVPFTLWAASRHADDFAEAMWTTVAALGDRDTTCAIVGGIVACRVGEDGIPLLWRHSRERLDGLWPARETV